MTPPSGMPRRNGPVLVLASASPRRADILDLLGLEFQVHPASLDESYLPGESPREHVLRLARAKAAAVEGEYPGSLVIAGDTVVVLDERVLGKPASPEEAVEMLMDLSGRSHQVLTGLAVASPEGRVVSGVQSTDVEFRAYGEAAARAYVATGEPMDKAGAYGIQGRGVALAERLEGDYFNVVGLPVPLLLRLLEECGWSYGFGELIPLTERGRGGEGASHKGRP